MQPETTQEFEAEIFRKCSILESIASQYAPASPEYLAVRDAAEALILVLRRKSLRTAFQKLKSMTGLTPEMVENLRRMGIDPDEMDEDDEC
ncbi:MAG: hypothetical protein WCJ09_26630 [Planctomycetota bacterium]